MAHVLIVGKAFSGIKEYLAAHGHTWTTLQDISVTKSPEKHLKNRVVVDILDEQAVLSAVNEINKTQAIDAAVVIYEPYVLINAIIASHLGLPGLPRSAAEACTDKELMRKLFSQAPIKISPDFAVVDSRDTLIDFASNHDYPLILKPANLAKSLLVTKSDNLEQLLVNYDNATRLISNTYKKYAPGRTPKLLVEEYLSGHIHSVDVFVDINGTPRVLENIVDYQTGFDIGYDDNFHYSRILPSKLPQNEIEAIRHAAAVGCKSLGMASSPAHVEIIYTNDGPRIVEIGARNGGYRERMHSLANGIDITGNALALSLNQPLDVKSKKNDNVAVLELFPKMPGKFIEITHEAELRNLASFQYVSVKAKPGNLVGKAGDGYKMCAVVILHHPDLNQFETDLQFVNENCLVRTA